MLFWDTENANGKDGSGCAVAVLRLAAQRRPPKGEIRVFDVKRGLLSYHHLRRADFAR
jgi:hypothetical protein